MVTNLLGMAEGLLLALLGLGMGALAGGDDYTLLLNPRLAWLTGLAGGLLTVAGAALAMAPARPKASRVAGLLVVLALLAAHQPRQGMVPPGGLTGSGPAEAVAPRETLDGTEYVRVNAAELYFLTREADPYRLRADYVTRGVVRRHPELDAAGEVAVVRIAVNCCLADAVALGLRVRVENPAALADNSWVKVWGVLEAADQPPPGGMTAQGIFPVALAREQRLKARKVAVEPAELPFVFEMRAAEPFAW